ncbi:MAG: ComEC/Rec2 family competence protein [Planctomycetes bacterium]|nr:ComEC/Rec2 family competence protein [Planctomycetota bacterium]
MTPPLRPVAVALLGGAAAGAFAGVPPAAACVASLTVAILALALGRRRRLAWTIAAAALAFAAASVRGAPRGPSLLSLPTFDVAAADGVLISGPDMVHGMRDRQGVRSASLRIEVGDCQARVLVQLPDDAALPQLLPGDRLRVIGRVRPRRPPSNPGESQSRRAPEFEIDAATVVREDGGALGAIEGLRRVAERLRRTTRDRLCDACGGETPTFGVFLCLLTGDRSALPPEVARAFRDSGTAHLLAVSGLHLVLLVGGLAAVARRLVPAFVLRRTGVVAIAATVLLYSAVCRFDTPVVRSAVFLVVGAIGRASRRRTSTLDHLALAATIVIGADPPQVADPGFQLSFAAVAGISLFATRIRDTLFPRLLLLAKFPGAIPARRLRWMRALATSFATTLAAQAATAPIVAAAFGSAQPAGIVANLFAVPIFAVVLPLAAALAMVGGACATLTTRLADFACAVFVGSVDVAAAAPLGHFALGRPPPWATAASVAILVSAAMLRTWRRRDLWLLVGAATLPGFAAAIQPRDSAAEVVALDVGHGLAVVLRSPAGGTILYDAGGRSPGVGDRVIVPALRELGVRQIDVLCLSHEDSDHCGAAADVLREVAVGRVVVSAGFGASPLAMSVLDACREAAIPVAAALAGDRISVAGIEAIALHPSAPAASGAENVDSLVLHAVVSDARIAGGAGLSVLLTGDLEGPPLTALAARTDLLRADVLVLPHHGRGDGEAQQRLALAIAARVSVASSSDASTVTMPGAWVTGTTGAIRFRAGRTPDVFPWRRPGPDDP